MGLVKKAIAECLGTFVLVFCAVGAAVGGAGTVGTSIAFGLVIVAMAYSIGRISGCHINPAVSLGCLVAKRMTVKEFLVYIAAQTVGAIIGGIALYGFFAMSSKTDTLGYVTQALAANSGCNSFMGLFNYDNIGNMFASIGVEIVLTFIFVYVILNVTDSNATEGDEYKRGTGQIAGIIIGLTLCLVHLIGCGMTGTSVNPARSIGTAVASLIYTGDASALSVVWVFIAAPLAGGALAAVVYGLLHKADKQEA